MTMEKIADKKTKFTNHDLIPDVWACEQPVETYFVTNPSVQRFGDRWLMAYKIVTMGYQSERFAICRLDKHFQVVPGSAVPLSATIPNSTAQVGDPRLLVYAGRLWVLYCHFRLPSLLYLAEVDPETLQAVGPAHPLLLDDRQWQEKNWMLFEYEDELLAVYTIAPHVVLHLEMNPRVDTIRCRRINCTEWDVSRYERRFGTPRGGALPVRVDGAYYAFFHSRYYVSRLHALLAPAWYSLRARIGKPEHWQGPRLADGDVRPIQAGSDWIYQPAPLPFRLDALLRRYELAFARRRYVAGVYAFAARPPFTPLTISAVPLLHPDEEDLPERSNRLSPLNERVVFVSGAVHLDNHRWLVSYGIHDERCALREVELAPELMR